MEIINTLLDQPWFEIVAGIVTLASAIAAVTPTPKVGSWRSKLYSLIDVAALNIGKAKNEGKKEAEKETADTPKD